MFEGIRDKMREVVRDLTYVMKTTGFPFLT